VAAWVLTLPAAGAIGAAVYGIAHIFGSGATGPVVITAAIVVALGVALARRLSQGRAITAAEG
jgi:inorganic phosphate transporter, PiT family